VQVTSDPFKDKETPWMMMKGAINKAIKDHTRTRQASVMHAINIKAMVEVINNHTRKEVTHKERPSGIRKKDTMVKATKMKKNHKKKEEMK